MMICPDCAVVPGQWHRPGCSWEQCPYCGEYLGDCDCTPPLDDRLPWTGCCPWLEACLKFGLFERRVRGAWVPCRVRDAGAQPDVTRLLRECRWNRRDKRFERRRRIRR